MNNEAVLLLIVIGLVGGIASGLFGIGGGLLIVPALVYLAGFTQHEATGTSLAVLLPPVGLAAVIEYYRHGHIDLPAALILAIAVFSGGWIGAIIANRIAGPYLRLAFGLFVIGVGCYVLYSALRQLTWI